MKSKTFLKTIALFPLFSCLTSCSTGKADLIFSPGEDKSFAYHELENESFVKLRNSVDSFSAKVSEKLFETYDDDVNIAFSPVSIYLDLGLGAKAGAGNTRNEILDAFRDLGLDEPYRKIREYSGGMKRRVSLIRAMLAESDIILLDEPFTGLDSHCAESACRFILKHQKGRTIILVTHEGEDAVSLPFDACIML